MRKPARVMIKAKDLTREPPRGPRDRIGRYVVLARAVDKGRAELNGSAGEYHFNCPLDQRLFNFKKVDAEEVRELLRSGATDEQVVKWFDERGDEQRDQDIKAWCDDVEAFRPYEDGEMKDWFVAVCKPLGLDLRQNDAFRLLGGRRSS